MKADVSVAPVFEGATRTMAVRFAVIAIVIAELSLFYHPKGFAGGPSDDQRYFDVALAWFRDGPQAGTTHWSLRMPLILTADAMFALIGPTIKAFLVVPRLYYALFVGVTAGSVARLAGLRTAGLWLALAICSPILHAMGSSGYPEILELAFDAVSIAAFLFARREARPAARYGWMALSGLALGLAVITRETSAFLFVGYAWAAVWRPGMRRDAYVALAAGAILPVVVQVGWLWAMTGDPLYRFHVDQHHIMIASDYLKGGVYHGSPFFNPDLARRWKPAGPTRIHWLLNPFGDFLIDPKFGFALLGCLIVAIPWFRGGRRLRLPPGGIPLLAAIAAGSYLIVTWVFTLRPQPRYYFPIAIAGQIGFALAIAAARAHPSLKPRATALFGAVLVGGSIPIALAHDVGWQADLLVGFMRTHPGRYATEPHVAGRAAQLAIEHRLPPPTVGDPPVGGYRVRLQTRRVVEGKTPFRLDPNYAPVAKLFMPLPPLAQWLRPNHRKALYVERRLF